MGWGKSRGVGPNHPRWMSGVVEGSWSAPPSRGFGCHLEKGRFANSFWCSCHRGATKVFNGVEWVGVSLRIVLFHNCME